MDFDKLYDIFCEYYKDDGSNDVIMKGRIEKAFLKYAQKLVKNNVDLADVSKRLSNDEINRLANDFLKSRFDNLNSEVWADEIKYENDLFRKGIEAALNAC